jgi:hypothetical protein
MNSLVSIQTTNPWTQVRATKRTITGKANWNSEALFHLATGFALLGLAISFLERQSQLSNGGLPQG